MIVIGAKGTENKNKPLDNQKQTGNLARRGRILQDDHWVLRKNNVVLNLQDDHWVLRTDYRQKQKPQKTSQLHPV